MEIKKRYKMYKIGKLWACAAISLAGIALLGYGNTENAQASTIGGGAPISYNNKVPVDTTTVNNNVNANSGHLDNYSTTVDSNNNVQLNASGWQATGQSNNEPYRWAIVYDNNENREINRQRLTPITRPDVQKAYPNVDNSVNSGFNLKTSIPASALNHSLSIISRYSNDPLYGEGGKTDVWFGPLRFDQGNYGNMDSIKVQDNKVTISGWHASNKAVSMQYHYVIAFDSSKNHEIARKLVSYQDSKRQDVAKAYPTIANAANSGFKATFELTPEFASDNIQFISRYTNDPAGNGIQTVDYWFNPVNKENHGYLDSFNLSNGNLAVSGWHATDAAIYETNHFLIVYDNTANRQVAQANVELLPSLDVARAYPNTKTASTSRFTYNFGKLNLQAGHTYSIVSRYSTASNGNGGAGVYTDYWYPEITLNKSGYSIDSWSPSVNSLSITGWLANDKAVNYKYAYAILLDDYGELGRQRLNFTKRMDVANVYPSLYNSLNSGFEATINFNRRLNNNDHLRLVLRYTNDQNGNGQDPVDVWLNNYTTNAGHFDNISINNNTISLSGWHASSSSFDKPHQFIIAMDANNNREIARWNITDRSGIKRFDVQKAYPWILNSEKSGFKLTVNNINLTNYANVYFIHRYTNDPQGNGSYVDYASGIVTLANYNMYANAINSYIINNRINHAAIQYHYVIPQVTGPYRGTANGRPNMVIVHETDIRNDSLWGDIEMEHNTYHRAFVHAFVDGNNIVEISPTDREAWGAGYPANGRGVQFEQVEVTGKDNFARELVNAAYYTAFNMKKYNMVPILNGANGTLLSHHMISMYFGGTDHVDPDGYWARNAASYFNTSYTMNDFYELVKYEYYNL